MAQQKKTCFLAFEKYEFCYLISEGLNKNVKVCKSFKTEF